MFWPVFHNFLFMMNIIRKINDTIAKLEEGLLVFIVVVMVLLAFLQVLLRNIFDHNLLWGDPFLRHMVLWVGFIGASLTTKDEKHINIDVLSRFLRGKARLLANWFTDLLAAAVSSVLAWAAWQFVMEEKEYANIAFAGIPSWYFQIIIVIGFGLMALRFLMHALEKTVLLMGRKGKRP